MDHIIVFCFVFVYPVWAGYRFGQVKRGSKTLPRAYLESAVGQWAVTILVIAYVGMTGTLSGIGISLAPGWRMTVSMIAAAAGVLFFLYQAWGLTRSEEARQSVRRQIGRIAPIMPRTLPQLGGFIPLAITAGICEEILFRGFLIDYFARQFDVITGFFVSSIVFGLAHAYQGPKGIVQATIAGIVFAALYLLSGSLLAPIVLHIVVDLHGGWAGYYVTSRRRAEREYPV